MTKIEIICRDGNLVLEEGGNFPPYSDEKLEEECGLVPLVRGFKPGKSFLDIEAGYVTLYRYKPDDGKEVGIVVSGNPLSHRVVAIDEDPQKAVARGLLAELSTVLEHGRIDEIRDVVVVYSKLLEKI